MRGFGWTMIVLGVALTIWSCVITTSVHTDSSYLPGIGYQPPSDTYNLGLLQRQMMMLHAGLVLFLSGIVAVCIAQLRNAMRAAGTAHYIGIWEIDAPKPVTAVPVLPVTSGGPEVTSAVAPGGEPNPST